MYFMKSYHVRPFIEENSEDHVGPFILERNVIGIIFQRSVEEEYMVIRPVTNSVILVS